jgi:hypothetical protein
VNFVSIWGSTLHHLDDLPYNPTEYFPHVYGNFRKKQEHVKVRQILPSPEKGELPLPDKKNLSKTELSSLSFLPKLEDFGFKKDEAN